MTTIKCSATAIRTAQQNEYTGRLVEALVVVSALFVVIEHHEQLLYKIKLHVSAEGSVSQKQTMNDLMSNVQMSEQKHVTDTAFTVFGQVLDALHLIQQTANEPT